MVLIKRTLYVRTHVAVHGCNGCCSKYPVFCVHISLTYEPWNVTRIHLFTRILRIVARESLFFYELVQLKIGHKSFKDVETVFIHWILLLLTQEQLFVHLQSFIFQFSFLRSLLCQSYMEAVCNLYCAVSDGHKNAISCMLNFLKRCKLCWYFADDYNWSF